MQDAEQYYLSHRNEFTVPERVNVKRIVFDSKAKAQDALAAFRKGMSFEEFKKQHPELRIKIDTLWLQHTEAASEMERIAFSLREGELSDVLAAQKGYYTLHVEKESPGRTQSFDEVKKALSARLPAGQRRGIGGKNKKRSAGGA